MEKSMDILRKKLDEVASEYKLDDYKFDIVPVGTGGANYFSKNFKVKLTSTDKEINLFAKVAEFSDTVRAQVPVDALYGKEITMYSRILSKYDELQEKYAIPEEDRFKSPKYYAGSSKGGEECIIMEDLCHQGHALYDRLKSVSLDYAFKGVKELAKYHALSLAFKHEYPNEYEEIFRNDKELFISLYEIVSGTNRAMSHTALATVPDHLKDRVQRFLKEQLSKETHVKNFATSTHGVIIHGDYNATNVLSKIQDEKVTSFIPIDYQTYRLGIASSDLIYFIYCGTDEKFRKLHLKQIIDHYYDTFASFLRLLNMDPDREFSREEFDAEYKNTLSHGLMTALTVLTVVMIDPEKAPTTTGSDGDLISAFVPVNESEALKERLIPILNEFIEYGVI